MRVGIGHDTHRLEKGRPLFLGGVRIEHSHGLVGHSDADVVLHALTDALLGAAGLGDIGDAYPDTDPAFKDRDSSFFAQKPKLGPVKERIRKNLADLLEMNVDAVNVKAKTGEGVDAIGREEAISCQVAVLI